MSRSFCANEKGVTLFLVLWILVLLSVMAGEFCRTIRTEVNMTYDFSSRTKAYYAAYAGIQEGIEWVVTSSAKVAQKVHLKLNPEDEEQAPWRINTELPPVAFGEDCSYLLRIDNESGKIDINRADAGTLRMLLSIFDLDDSDRDVIVDSILDWRDKDNLHRLNGAEDDYYRSLPEPYECKDGDFDTVQELLLVRGVTPEIFYGGLKDMVTVFGGSEAEKKKGKKGVNKINLNAASPQVLKALPLMDDEAVNEIMEFRREEDFTSLSQLAPLIGGEKYKAVARYLTLDSGPYYTLSCTGLSQAGAVRQSIQAVVLLDPTAPERYRILRWNDLADQPAPLPKRKLLEILRDVVEKEGY